MITTTNHPIGSRISPSLIIKVNDETLGSLGCVVIDRPIQGTTFGPILSSPDVSPDELIPLARTITHKLAFLNMPLGGAMAGIWADSDRLGCEREVLMRAFGRSITALIRQQVYHPGADLGTTVDDLRAIMAESGRPMTGQQIDSAFFTGSTVFKTIQQIAQFNNLALSDLRVGLEGFGKVGTVVAKLLAQAGAKLTVLSTSQGGISAEKGLDISTLLSLRQQYGGQLVHHYPGATQITREALFTQPVDLLIPGARPYSIHANNAHQIQAKWIVPIANTYVTPEAEQILIERAVLVVPDFVANCGGLLAVDMRSAGFDAQDVQYMIETTFARIITTLLHLADQEKRPTAEIARTVSWQNHQGLNLGIAHSSSNKLSKIKAISKGQGLNEITRRLAWRIHHRQKRLPGVVRRAAIDRFAEWRLRVTLDRLISFNSGDLRQ